MVDKTLDVLAMREDNEQSGDRDSARRGKIRPVKIEREERAGKRRIRVYYHLEPEGLARLNNLREEYQNLRDGIDAMLTCEILPCEDGES